MTDHEIVVAVRSMIAAPAATEEDDTLRRKSIDEDPHHFLENGIVVVS